MERKRIFYSIYFPFFDVVYVQINEFVKRARAAKIHAFIISHLKKEMPAMMGKAKTQQKLIDNLEDVFAKVLSSVTVTVTVYCVLYIDGVL